MRAEDTRVVVGRTGRSEICLRSDPRESLRCSTSMRVNRSRSLGARAKLWLGAALLLAVFVTLLVASRARRAALQAPPCPPGLREDAPRAARVRRLVATLPDGAALWRGEPFARLCFGESRVPATMPDGRLVLDGQASDAEVAARVRHLLAHHATRFAPVHGFDSARACAPQLDEALDAEARALVRELADRERLHVSSPRLAFAFADDVRRAPDDAARVRLVRAFLDAHPHGGGGVDALAAGYAAACARAVSGRRASDARGRAAP
jgi:hypothetical protein